MCFTVDFKIKVKYYGEKKTNNKVIDILIEYNFVEFCLEII